MRSARVLLLFVIALVACGGAQTRSTPTATPWRIFTVTRSPSTPDLKPLPRMRLSLPPEWDMAPNDGEWFKRVADQYSAGGRVTLLFLAEAEDVDGDPTVTVTTWRLSDEYPEDSITVLEIAEATYLNYSASVQALTVQSRSDEIGGMPVRRQELRWESKIAGKPATLWVVQYFAKRGRELYMLEFEAPFENRGALVDVFDAIAATFVLP